MPKEFFGQDSLVVNLNGKGNSTLWYFIFKTSFDFQLCAILHIPDFFYQPITDIKAFKEGFPKEKFPFAVFLGQLEI